MSDEPYDYGYWDVYEELVEKYEAPPGKKWVWIGSCECRGLDHDCVYNDDNWELVDE